MLDLIDLLEQFNRKERFFLVLKAMDEAEFPLPSNFRSEVGSRIGVRIPCDVFAATDYHIDWIAASVGAYRRQSIDGVFPNSGDDKVVMATNQDIDFLIAFKVEEFYHLIFLEAKGYEKWDIDQLISKANRLKRIFRESEQERRHDSRLKTVKPHFCLISPEWSPPPRDTQIDIWSAWLKLDLPLERHEVHLCDSTGSNTGHKEGFRIEKVKYSGTDNTQDLRYERNNPDRTTKTGKKDKRYGVNRNPARGSRPEAIK